MKTNDSKLTLDVGQAHEIKLAMIRAGNWTNELIKKLCEGDSLDKVRNVLLGVSEVVPVMVGMGTPCTTHLIVDVFEHHPENGLDLRKEILGVYHSSSQKIADPFMEGSVLQAELEGQQVLNANVLDFLLQSIILILILIFDLHGVKNLLL